MKSKLMIALPVLILAFAALKTITFTQAEPASNALIQRGRYLAERVAMRRLSHAT